MNKKTAGGIYCGKTVCEVNAMSKKKKSKVPKLTEEEYRNYLLSLGGDAASEVKEELSKK